jgi:hypothetical protein
MNEPGFTILQWNYAGYYEITGTFFHNKNDAIMCVNLKYTFEIVRIVPCERDNNNNLILYGEK